MKTIDNISKKSIVDKVIIVAIQHLARFTLEYKYIMIAIEILIKILFNPTGKLFFNIKHPKFNSVKQLIKNQLFI